MPSKYFSNSLPYRRLQKFANGIWDEERKTFYPFKSAWATISAKQGIHYYIKSATISACNSGDHGEGTIYIQYTQLGITCRAITGKVAASVAASSVNQSTFLSSDVNVLTDANTEITCITNASSGSYSIIYAEIPADPAGGPVVVQ